MVGFGQGTQNGRAGRKSTIVGRSKSASLDGSASCTTWRKVKGILKITTLDESLHSRYGSESSDASDDNKKKHHIQFTHIEVRSYNRTVGDNPSVSAGKSMLLM